MQEPNLVVLILSFIFTFFSSFLSFITCIIFIRKRDLRNYYAYRLILIISLTDVLIWGNHAFNNFFYLISSHDLEVLSHVYCVISSVFRCFNGLINLYCIFMIGFSLYVNQIIRKDPVIYEKTAYIFIVALSIGISIIPAILGEYAKLEDRIQCWIPNPMTNFLVYYLTVLFVLISNTYFVLRIIIRRIHTNIIREIVCKISLYPVILLISWFPGMIKIITGLEHPILIAFIYCCMPLQGILNPFIYGRIFFRYHNSTPHTTHLNMIEEKN